MDRISNTKKNLNSDSASTRRAVVMAPASTVRDTLVEQLLQLDVAVERAETLAQTQRLVARQKPRFAFVDSARYPLPSHDIAALLHDAIDGDASPPRLVALAHQGSPGSGPDARDRFDVLTVPIDVAELKALLCSRVPDAASDVADEHAALDCAAVAG